MDENHMTLQCTHAGGIVFRLSNNVVEYLLIGPSKERPNEWLFPKGHIEIGEDRPTAALREVKEETGVIARIVAPLEVSEIQLTNKKIVVQYYLMEMIFQESCCEERRKAWFPFEEAVKIISHEANRALLKDAEGRRALR
jgi:8-oxo-dGTP pyrophosphatase MutT (NUDIX family)